jgi:hypothetical protein
VISKTGEVQYSNILVIHLKQTKTLISIIPNPAKDNIGVMFFAEKDGTVTLRLLDNMGKTVLINNRYVVRGNNILPLTGLTKFSNGVYSVQLFVNGEVLTQKVVIAN